jgi:hypothetical protein
LLPGSTARCRQALEFAGRIAGGEIIIRKGPALPLHPFHPVGGMIRQASPSEIDNAREWAPGVKDSGDPGDIGGNDDVGTI